ncbi:hypothetical protein LSM04_003022 [Trypanosoma melophagium]|uniref:uncharacterized protein n=1 Tax=Trypanosoma melophagium TaxID=715481 RepID=UPI00351A29D1|nr:hypothetical protein LSM04_003022 [Trypanosoma melophagium]
MEPNNFMDWESVCPSIIGFIMPRNQNFLQIFETTNNLFGAEWAALGEQALRLHQEYNSARAQLEHEAFRAQQTANIQLQELQNQLAQMHQQANTQALLAASHKQLNQTLEEPRLLQNQHAATQAQLKSALENYNQTEQPSVPGETKEPKISSLQGRNITSWAGKPAPDLPENEEHPKLGLRGIQERRQPTWLESSRPIEKIRTFDGLMEFLTDTSPREVVAAYRQLFPRLVNPAPFYQDAWDMFIQWLDSFPYEEPWQKEDPIAQAVNKVKRKQSLPPPSKARCFRCGRIGHYSTTCRVNAYREPFKPKNNTVSETRRPHGTPTQHGAILRPLGRNNKQVRTLDIIDVKELEK